MYYEKEIGNVPWAVRVGGVGENIWGFSEKLKRDFLSQFFAQLKKKKVKIFSVHHFVCMNILKFLSQCF